MEEITWRRVVNDTIKESVLDHVYVKNYYQVETPHCVWPIFGDHAAVIFTIEQESIKPDPILKRDWRSYSPEILCQKLSTVSWEFESDLVQDFWNELENQLISIVDSVAPMILHTNEVVTQLITKQRVAGRPLVFL